MRHAYEGGANVVAAMVLAVADDLRHATERAGGHGASGPAALVALDGLAAGGSIDALARVCGLSHSGTVRLVDRLEAADLVERRMGGDGRSVALRLTPQGRRVARRILAQREAVVATALAPLDAAQRSALASAAAAVLAGMAAGGRPEGRICRLCDTDACGRPRDRCPVARAARERAAGLAGTSHTSGHAEEVNENPQS
jgi:MarR family transcriptional regulator, negative regulator of the multidrug operon emrRAB